MPFSTDSLCYGYGFTCALKYKSECNWRSACESIEQLVEYFGSDFAWALEQGASIVEYRVLKRNVRFGVGIEVVFDASKIIERLVILKGKDSEAKKEPLKDSFRVTINEGALTAWAIPQTSEVNFDLTKSSVKTTISIY